MNVVSLFWSIPEIRMGHRMKIAALIYRKEISGGVVVIELSWRAAASSYRWLISTSHVGKLGVTRVIYGHNTALLVAPSTCRFHQQLILLGSTLCTYRRFRPRNILPVNFTIILGLNFEDNSVIKYSNWNIVCFQTQTVDTCSAL